MRTLTLRKTAERPAEARLKKPPCMAEPLQIVHSIQAAVPLRPRYKGFLPRRSPHTRYYYCQNKTSRGFGGRSAAAVICGCRWNFYLSHGRTLPSFTVPEHHSVPIASGLLANVAHSTHEGHGYGHDGEAHGWSGRHAHEAADGWQAWTGTTASSAVSGGAAAVDWQGAAGTTSFASQPASIGISVPQAAEAGSTETCNAGQERQAVSYQFSFSIPALPAAGAQQVASQTGWQPLMAGGGTGSHEVAANAGCAMSQAAVPAEFSFSIAQMASTVRQHEEGPAYASAPVPIPPIPCSQAGNQPIQSQAPATIASAYTALQSGANVQAVDAPAQPAFQFQENTGALAPGAAIAASIGPGMIASIAAGATEGGARISYPAAVRKKAVMLRVTQAAAVPE